MRQSAEIYSPIMRLTMIQQVLKMPNFEPTPVLVIKAVGSLSASIRMRLSSGSSGSVSHLEAGCFCSSICGEGGCLSIVSTTMSVNYMRKWKESCLEGFLSCEKTKVWRTGKGTTFSYLTNITSAR